MDPVVGSASGRIRAGRLWTSILLGVLLTACSSAGSGGGTPSASPEVSESPSGSSEPGYRPAGHRVDRRRTPCDSHQGRPQPGLDHARRAVRMGRQRGQGRRVLQPGDGEAGRVGRDGDQRLPSHGLGLRGSVGDRLREQPAHPDQPPDRGDRRTDHVALLCTGRGVVDRSWGGRSVRPGGQRRCDDRADRPEDEHGDGHVRGGPDQRDAGRLRRAVADGWRPDQRLAPRSDQPVTGMPSSRSPRAPVSSPWVEGSVWVLGTDPGVVTRVDPDTDVVEATINVSDGPVSGGDIAVGGGYVLGPDLRCAGGADRSGHESGRPAMGAARRKRQRRCRRRRRVGVRA